MPKEKLKLKGKTIAFLLLYTVIMSFIVVGVYYAAIIYPKLTSAKALFNTKGDIYHLYSLNVEEKLATNGLIALKPSSVNFYEEKARLFESAEEAQGKLSEALNTFEVKQKGTKEVKALLTDIDGVIKDDTEENKKVLDVKKEILGDFKKVDLVLDKIFGFSPGVEFGRYSFPEDKEKAIESVATTKNGLTKIEEDMKKLDDYQNQELYEAINSVITILDQMDRGLESDQFSQVEDDIISLERVYPDVVNEAKATLNMPLVESKALDALTRQTNLILEYEFLMNRIEALQISDHSEKSL